MRDLTNMGYLCWNLSFNAYPDILRLLLFVHYPSCPFPTYLSCARMCNASVSDRELRGEVRRKHDPDVLLREVGGQGQRSRRAGESRDVPCNEIVVRSFTLSPVPSDQAGPFAMLSAAVFGIMRRQPLGSISFCRAYLTWNSHARIEKAFSQPRSILRRLW